MFSMSRQMTSMIYSMRPMIHWIWSHDSLDAIHKRHMRSINHWMLPMIHRMAGINHWMIDYDDLEEESRRFGQYLRLFHL